MDERFSRFGAPGREYGRAYDDYDDRPTYGSRRDYGYSSARDYAAARDDRLRGPSSRSDYSPSRSWDREQERGWRERSDYRERDDRRDRGFLDRAGDEVMAWFGDEEAERRREMDRRYDARRSGPSDDHYHSWRSSRIAELDRDYDEYRRENAQRFESEFNSWRTERQGQRQGLSRVSEHMEVIGSDGGHIGTVDKVRGDRIILTKNDADAGGHHHSIPSRWIDSVDDKVKIRKTADEAKAAWRDEDRSGAFFGGADRDAESWRTDHNLNRSFSGTY